MIRLLAVRIYIAVLQRALAISGKLKPKTWAYVAVTQALLAAICFWGYQSVKRETQPTETQTAQVHVIDVSGSPSSVPIRELNLTAEIQPISITHFYTLDYEVQGFDFSPYVESYQLEPGRGYSIYIQGSNFYSASAILAHDYNYTTVYSTYYNHLGRRLTASAPHLHFAVQTNGSLSWDASAMTSALTSMEESRSNGAVSPVGVWSSSVQDFFPLPQLPQYKVPFTMQFSAPESMSLYDMLLKPLLLFQGIIFTIGSALSSVFAWLQYRRGKADLKLKELQISEMQIRIENMERDRARDRARTEQEAAQSGIILLS